MPTFRRAAPALVSLAVVLAALGGCPSDAAAPSIGDAQGPAPERDAIGDAQTNAPAPSLDAVASGEGPPDTAAAEDATPDATTAAPAGVVVNEIVAKAADGGADWIELFNRGAVPVSLGGYRLEDDGGHSWTFPARTFIDAGEHLVWTEADFAFGLGKADGVALLDDEGRVVDAVAWEDGDAPGGQSYGRTPDGTDDFATLAPTPGAANP